MTFRIEQRVARADNGMGTAIGQLAFAEKPSLLWSLDERMRLVKRPVAGGVTRGEQEVFWLKAGVRTTALADRRARCPEGGRVEFGIATDSR